MALPDRLDKQRTAAQPGVDRWRVPPPIGVWITLHQAIVSFE